MGLLRHAFALVLLALGVSCGRSDPTAFDEFHDSTGGTSIGGTSNGGTGNGGTGNGGTGTGGPCALGDIRCSGVCRDTSTDPNHCGRCGATCSDFEDCIDGRCTSSFCPPGLAFCDSGCVDPSVDRFNCGGCGAVCAPDQTCSRGFCMGGCPPELWICDGVCTDIRTDPSNCGTCDQTCVAGTFCRDGFCACPSGLVACANGGCVDLQSDSGNCGSCAQVCGPGQSCVMGSCRGTANGYSVGTSSVAFIDACTQPGALSGLRNVDDDVLSVMLPIGFRFFGVNRTSAWFSSNGVVGFGAASAEYTNQCSVGLISNAILAFWDDLLTGPSGACMATLGTAPNRQLVFTWSHVRLLEMSNSDLSFSVILNEATNIIDVTYGSMSGGPLASGTSATIGVGNQTSMTLACCNQSCVGSNSGYRFTPN